MYDWYPKLGMILERENMWVQETKEKLAADVLNSKRSIFSKAVNTI